MGTGDDEPADAPGDIPDGAAVFPAIPAELGVHPLLLAVLHATVFLAGSDDELVHPAAGGEALEQMAEYLQRLSGAELRRAREDMATLVAYARQSKWPKQEVQMLKQFLNDCGVGGEESEVAE